ncbi:MAG: Rpn family recombination-promoting nuclease/putative transposase [Myxococcaceae bacterium]|nr:Rpn family recombination-promoting nuclease/putative transposase [Myxococcaceae bacterium]
MRPARDAAFRVAQHGRPAFLYVLLEHQRTSDPLMPWRLLRYMTNLWLSVLGHEPTRTRLPMLLPMVLSNVPGGWRGPTSFAEVLELDADQADAFAPSPPAFRSSSTTSRPRPPTRCRRGPGLTSRACALVAGVVFRPGAGDWRGAAVVRGGVPAAAPGSP